MTWEKAVGPSVKVKGGERRMRGRKEGRKKERKVKDKRNEGCRDERRKVIAKVTEECKKGEGGNDARKVTEGRWRNDGRKMKASILEGA